MATYDYKCPKCDTLIEIEKPIQEGDSEERCPSCNTILKKIFKPNPIKFLGTGWTNGSSRS
jgi:putative FmdB family regulatory protein